MVSLGIPGKTKPGFLIMCLITFNSSNEGVINIYFVFKAFGLDKLNHIIFCIYLDYLCLVFSLFSL